MDILAAQNFHPFFIHDLALRVHNVVVLYDVFSYAEVPAFYRFLRVLYRARKHFSGKRGVFVHLKKVVSSFKPFAAESFGKFVFERNKENRGSRIALTAASAAQLIVYSARFVPFRADYLKTAERGHALFFSVGNDLMLFV